MRCLNISEMSHLTDYLLFVSAPLGVIWDVRHESRGKKGCESF